MKIGQHVDVVDRDGGGFISGVYAGEDSLDYFIVIDVGGLVQILTFGKVGWKLRETEGFTDIQWVLDDQQGYMQALYGQEDKRSLGGK